MGAILVGLFMLGLFVGPLVARLVLDRRAERAAVVAADIRALIRGRLGGESVVSVQVEPRGLWRSGLVRLSAPGGYEGLIEKVWPVVFRRMPAGHDLVVRPSSSRLAADTAEAPRLSRAA